jgi:hypothetical protein
MTCFGARPWRRMCFVLDGQTLEYEIAEERASALGRLGRRLEAALTALAACPPATSERTIRDSLVEEAGYALWLFIVQRESCGLNDSTHVMQTYGVPSEVYAHMGPSAIPTALSGYSVRSNPAARVKRRPECKCCVTNSTVLAAPRNPPLRQSIAVARSRFRRGTPPNAGAQPVSDNIQPIVRA